MRHEWIALAGSILVVAGCGHETIDFNNQVAAIHARLGTAVEEFGRTLRPAIDEGKPPTADELARAIERLRARLSAANAESAQLRVPDLPQAGDLRAAHQAFLAAEESLLEQEFAEIERLLSQSLAAGELDQRLQARCEAFRAAEARLLDAMHAAQRRFAEANRLKLTRPAQ